MNISVLGLGYVGCVTAACLAQAGHQVSGVDLDVHKVGLINSGKSPIVEPGLDSLLKEVVSAGRLTASTQLHQLGDISVICVGTPSNGNGSLGLNQMERVLDWLARLLATHSDDHLFVIRSTVLPETTEKFIIPRIEKGSGKKCGVDFGVCMNPEFMRETTAIQDFHSPPITVVGYQHSRDLERFRAMVRPLGFDNDLEATDIRTAELIKYACNAFHASKICFANEIGKIGKSLSIDSYKVMEILCKDRKLNISSTYLKPGFAFGGSCLPKDLRALLHKSHQLDLSLPMLESLLQSNRLQMQSALDRIIAADKKRVGIVGLSFKEGTDDLRESPLIWLIESLLGKGFKVTVYDKEVSLSKLYGSNKDYIDQKIPHISQLLVPDLETLFKSSDFIVVAKGNSEASEAVESFADGKHVLDLVRLSSAPSKTTSTYEGIAW